MVLKLYGFPLSTATRLVALVCKEKEIPYELVLVDLTKGEQKTPKHCEVQPFGQVPYIDDDGFILFESRAIARYLIKKYPNRGTSGLIPTDPKEEALFEQAVSIEAFDFQSVAIPLVTEQVFWRIRGVEPDPIKVAELSKKMDAILDVYEVILGKQRYLGGNHVTLADLQHLPMGSALFTGGLSELFTKRPNVSKWWNDIFNRPSWQAVKGGA